MNAMAQAIKASGIKTPTQMQRIWTFLKDNDRQLGRIAEDVSKAIGLPISSVSSILTSMGHRGMVTHKDGLSLKAKGRRVRYYRAVGNTYELQPVQSKSDAKWAPTTPAKFIPEPPEPHQERKVIQLVRKVNLDTLTIGEARELYVKLKEMFA